MNKQDISENYVVVKHFCSAKGCTSEAEYFLKLTSTSLAGWFCKECAEELIQAGVLEVIEAQ